MNRDGNKIVQLNKGKDSEVKFLPYLVPADESLHEKEKKNLLERLDRKHIEEGWLSGEGFIEIDLVGCDGLELVEGSQHDVMIHHGRERVKSSLNTAANSDDNRSGERYRASGVRVWIKPVTFFDWAKYQKACLLDFSTSGIGLVCDKKFSVNKRVLLKLEFPEEGAVFEMEGVVVRNHNPQATAKSSLNGVQLSQPGKPYKDCVLEEGLHRKLR